MRKVVGSLAVVVAWAWAVVFAFAPAPALAATTPDGWASCMSDARNRPVGGYGYTTAAAGMKAWAGVCGARPAGLMSTGSAAACVQATTTFSVAGGDICGLGSGQYSACMSGTGWPVSGSFWCGVSAATASVFVAGYTPSMLDWSLFSSYFAGALTELVPLLASVVGGLIGVVVSFWALKTGRRVFRAWAR